MTSGQDVWDTMAVHLRDFPIMTADELSVSLFSDTCLKYIVFCLYRIRINKACGHYGSRADNARYYASAVAIVAAMLRQNDLFAEVAYVVVSYQIALVDNWADSKRTWWTDRYDLDPLLSQLVPIGTYDTLLDAWGALVKNWEKLTPDVQFTLLRGPEEVPWDRKE